jgi:hypothetical protein
MRTRPSTRGKFLPGPDDQWKPADEQSRVPRNQLQSLKSSAKAVRFGQPYTPPEWAND